jgi:heat shock protein HslJ
MKNAVAILALTPLVTFSAGAQSPAPAAPPQAAPGEPAQTEASAAASTSTAGPTAEMEAKFKTTLTNATMSGRWALIKDGQLTPEQAEKYTITGVNKIFGERWLIRARIQYGEKDITIPVPVRVKWAGDTPVITVDDVGLPGGASYSARVIIYDDSYAGTWSGGNLRGLLNGVITRTP